MLRCAFHSEQIGHRQTSPHSLSGHVIRKVFRKNQKSGSTALLKNSLIPALAFPEKCRASNFGKSRAGFLSKRRTITSAEPAFSSEDPVSAGRRPGSAGRRHSPINFFSKQQQKQRRTSFQLSNSAIRCLTLSVLSIFIIISVHCKFGGREEISLELMIQVQTSLHAKVQMLFHHRASELSEQII